MPHPSVIMTDPAPGPRLRTATPADHPAIRRLVVAAFDQEFGVGEGPAVAGMVESIRVGAFARPEFEWVAVIPVAGERRGTGASAGDIAGAGELVVGHVCLSGTSVRRAAVCSPEETSTSSPGARTAFTDAIDSSAAASDRVVLMLAPLAVDAAWRGRGIGAALVRGVCAAADAAGEPLIVVEGSPDYYGRLGFEPAAPLGIRMALPDWAPPEAAQVRWLTTYDPADPTLRGTIVYPDYVPTG